MTSDVTYFATVSNTVIIMWLYEFHTYVCCESITSYLTSFIINSVWYYLYSLFITSSHKPHKPCAVSYIEWQKRVPRVHYNVMWWSRLIDQLWHQVLYKRALFFGGWGTSKMLKNVSRYESNMPWNSFKRPMCYISC